MPSNGTKPDKPKQFFGHFNYLSAQQTRQVMTSAHGAPGNQGKLLSQAESQELNSCLMVTPSVIHSEAQVVEDYMAMYEKKMPKERDVEKKICACNMYVWKKERQCWDTVPMRDHIREFDGESAQLQERINIRFKMNAQNHLGQLKQRKTKKIIQKLKNEFKQIQREQGFEKDPFSQFYDIESVIPLEIIQTNPRYRHFVDEADVKTKKMLKELEARYPMIRQKPSRARPDQIYFTGV